MTPDEDKDPFAYGDRTVFNLRAQSFDIESDYGTMMLRDAALPVVEVAAETPPPADPIARLEQKLDHALQLIEKMQHKIDSLDATLARALNR